MLRSRLALRWGCSLVELSQRVSAAELEEHWRLFDKIEPIGDARFDRLIAMLTRTVAFCGSKIWPGDDAYEMHWGQALIDLAPESIAEQEEQTKQHFRAALARRAESLNGRSDQH